MTLTKTLDAATHWARIYIAGPIEVAKQIVRRVCADGGLCVTIEPTTYVFKQGEEAGYVVGLINYPRFPESAESIDAKAEQLMHVLLDETFQGSALYMTPTVTRWVSKRVD